MRPLTHSDPCLLDDFGGAPICKIVASPAGDRLWTADTDRIVRSWDASGRLLWETDFRAKSERDRATERVRSMVLSDDSQDLFLTCGSTLHRVHAGSGEVAWEWEGGQILGFQTAMPQDVSITDDQRLLVSLDTGAFLQFDFYGNLLRKHHANDAPRYVALWAERGVLVGSDGFSLTTWNIKNLRQEARLALTETVYGLALLASEGVAAMRLSDRVILVQMDGFNIVAEYPTKPGLPLVAFCADGHVLALGHERGVDFWDRAGRSQAFSLDSERLVTFAPSKSEAKLHLGLSTGRMSTVAVPSFG